MGEFVGLHDESEFHGYFGGAVTPAEGAESNAVERWTKYSRAEGSGSVRLDDGVEMVLVDLGEAVEQPSIPWIDRTDERLTDEVVQRLKSLAWAKRPAGWQGAWQSEYAGGDRVRVAPVGNSAILILMAQDGEFEGRDGQMRPAFEFSTATAAMKLEAAKALLEQLNVFNDQQLLSRFAGWSRFAVVTRRLTGQTSVGPGRTRNDYEVISISGFADEESASSAMQAAREAFGLRVARDLDGLMTDEVDASSSESTEESLKALLDGDEEA